MPHELLEDEEFVEFMAEVISGGPPPLPAYAAAGGPQEEMEPLNTQASTIYLPSSSRYTGGPETMSHRLLISS